MLNRNALMLVAGAAIFALDASASAAQDTTRTRPTSSQRISIKKESGGEVVAPTVRVDTVFSYRTDTLRLPGRTDTVVTTNTVVRVDTVQIPMPAFLREIGGLYFGLGGGSNLPAANFNDSDKPGWRVEGVLGIDPIGSPLGLRLTGGWSRHHPHSYLAPFKEHGQVMNAALEAKLRALTVSPFDRRAQLYLTGGVTYNRFKSILEVDRGVASVGDTRVNLVPGQTMAGVDNGWHDGWGYNVGGGGQIGFGRTNLFVETRFSRFKGINTNISSVPILVGLSWF